MESNKRSIIGKIKRVSLKQKIKKIEQKIFVTL